MELTKKGSIPYISPIFTIDIHRIQPSDTAAAAVVSDLEHIPRGLLLFFWNRFFLSSFVLCFCECVSA